MTGREPIEADICVIGAGSAGLSVAAGAAQLGAKTVLVERDRMGGDCLNVGCVPSKSLLAAAKVAEAMRRAGQFGIRAGEPEVDFAAVGAHVRDVIASIAPHDSVERFEGLGVTVLRGHARFVAPGAIEVNGRRVDARRFVIATGSRPAVPAVPGLDRVAVLTNETIFDLDRLPRHLLILGGGPIGMEMAQAHRRLGAEVTVLERFTVLPHDDTELALVVRDRLASEGVVIREGSDIVGADAAGTGDITLRLSGGSVVTGSHLLVAAGRTPNVEDLGLDAAGIETDAKGIRVDRGLRTTNRRVYAIGDVAGQGQFTHLAGHHAGIVIRSALFRLPARAAPTALPWVTFTEPELAQAGMTLAQAQRDGIEAEPVVWRFSDNDRARAERTTQGMVKVVVGRRGRILGCGIVGAHAGELILPWVLAMERGLRLSAMASVLAPYPTLSEASKRAAGAWYAPRLFSPTTRWLVSILRRFG